MQRVTRLWLAMFVAMIGCIGGFRSVQAEEGTAWSYEGETGPAYWGELAPDYALCSTGTQQSPVNIPADAPLNTSNLGFQYEASALNILNNGHTIQVPYDPGSTLVLEDQNYELVQFHFHAASEHTKAGEQRPMEVHFVHANAANELAVVGAWVVDGAENANFAPILTNIPTVEEGTVQVEGTTINADRLLPAERNYYRYNGSLTTPPCTENVKWVMLDQTIEMSAEQIQAYTDVHSQNFRPVQPMNERSFLNVASTPIEAPSADLSPILPPTGTSGFPGFALYLVAILLLGLGVYIRHKKVA